MVKVSNRRKHIEGLMQLLAVSRLSRPPLQDEWLDSAGLASDQLHSLVKDHFTTMKGLYDPRDLSKVADEVNRAFANPALVSRPRKVPSFPLPTSLEDLERVGKLTDEEVAQGPAFWREITSSIALRDPLLVVPSITDLVLNPSVLSAVQGYVGGFPSLTYVKVVRTWANDLPSFDTQLWHVDFDSARMLKLFIFLHDIDSQTGGTKFVEGSHLFDNVGDYEYQDRWNEAELQRDFPASRVFNFEGSLGDAFFLDTNMVHKGVRPELRDRTVIIANYMLHEETLSEGELRVDPGYVAHLHPIQQLALQLGPIT